MNAIARTLAAVAFGLAAAAAVTDELKIPVGSQAIAHAVGGLVTGTVAAGDAADAFARALAGHGRSGSWAIFLSMAEALPDGGLYKQARDGLVPVWPADEAAKRAMIDRQLDPDNAYRDDPLEPQRLLLAMLCESYRPFGAAWGFVAPLLTIARAPQTSERPPATPSGSPS